MVQRVSRNQEANEAFLENNQRRTRPPPPCLMFVTVRQPPSPEPSFQNVPTPRTTLAKDSPTPMEVDRAQPRGGYPILCHRCNQTGHYEKWFKAAQRVSRNQEVNEAFLENNQRKKSSSSPLSDVCKRWSSTHGSRLSPAKGRISHSVPSLQPNWSL